MNDRNPYLRIVVLLSLVVMMVFEASAQDPRSLAWSYKPYPDVETAYTKGVYQYVLKAWQPISTFR